MLCRSLARILTLFTLLGLWDACQSLAYAKKPNLALSALCLLFIACFPLRGWANTLYVPSQYSTIQAALNVSGNGDVIVVADGTYTGTGNVDLDFLGNNVSVQSASGDPTRTIIDCGGTSYNHIIGFYFHSGETRALIQGLTVKNGYANYGGAVNVQSGSAVTLMNCIINKNNSYYNGGGIYNEGRITLDNCTISQNKALGNNGGGIDNTGTATLTNCLLSQNTTTYDGGGIGNGSSLTLTNCTLSQNSATGNGGGLVSYSDATLTNCNFTGNSATNGGGSYIDNNYESIIMINCIFVQNSATTNGGGIENENDGIILTNCTLTQNSATSGGGLYNDGTATLTNDILYGNSGYNISTNNASTYLTYCDTGTVATGIGNIAIDPMFVNAPTDLHLRRGSPCIGAGTTNISNGSYSATDLEGKTRSNPPTIGAYEGAASSPIHILWDNTNGTASIWNYSTTNGAFTALNFGPYAGWSAKTIADGGTDGLTRLLWNNTNGVAALWNVNTLNGAFSSNNFGPYTGWTAQAVSVGTDNTTHLLWTNTNGTAALWNVLGGQYQGEQDFGPYSGWTAKTLADGPDSKTRLLWTNTNGQAALWNVSPTTGAFSQFTFGPYSGWTAKAISAGAATTHVLWTNSNGTAAVWNYSPTTGVFTQNLYGPYSGWVANGLADGSDGKVRLLWDNVSGQAAFWSVDNATGLFSQFSFGPYSGWTATAITGGN